MQPTSDTPKPTTPDSRFFRDFGLLLIGLIVLGFGGRTLFGHDELRPELPILLPHILTVGGWYVLLVVQSALIACKNRALHRRLGKLSALLALGLVVTGVWVMAANYRLKDDAPLAFFNCLNLSQFVLLYILGIRRVKSDRLAHPRLLIWGAIAMMPPALVRIVQTVGLPEPITVIPMLALWIPPIRHDWQLLGRMQRGTRLGLTVVGLGLVIGPIGFTEVWAGWIEALAG
ncbi:MAG: hypothetical protein AAF196_07715 [Planctomycetota bacterium]